jgi:hypothetical protein
MFQLYVMKTLFINCPVFACLTWNTKTPDKPSCPCPSKTQFCLLHNFITVNGVCRTCTHELNLLDGVPILSIYILSQFPCQAFLKVMVSTLFPFSFTCFIQSLKELRRSNNPLYIMVIQPTSRSRFFQITLLSSKGPIIKCV